MRIYVAVFCLLAVSSITTGTASGQWFGTPGGPWNFPQMNMFPYTALPPPQPLIYPPSYYANPGSSSYNAYPSYYYAAPYGSTPAYVPGNGSSNNAFSSASAPTNVSANSTPPGSTSAAPAPNAAGGASFTLVNPRRNDRPVRYALNQFTYIMRPGESQTVPLNREWIITFTGGRNKTIKYRMEPGRYEFIDSPESGWSVFRQIPAAPAPPSEVAPSP